MKFIIENKLSRAKLSREDILLIPVWLDAKTAKKSSKNKTEDSFVLGGFAPFLNSVDKKLIKSYLAAEKRKDGEVKLLRLNEKPEFAFLAICEKFEAKKFPFLIRRFVLAAKREGLKNIGICLDDFENKGIKAEKLAEIISDNSLTAHLDFSEHFKTAPKEGWKSIESVVIFSRHGAANLRKGVERGEKIGEAVNRCRILANTPADKITPEGLAEAARQLTKQFKNLKLTVFDEKRLKSEGMNAILAVGRGSQNPPRLIALEYNGAKASNPIMAFVGKGITFDSGGLDLKPSDGMQDMYLDMSGGAAVVSVLGLIAALRLPVNAVGIVPAAENMPSGLSYHQGDIIKTYGGKTIEIGNTDAEGRVILADAIEYAKTKKPKLIVTIATLTGAAMVALGERMAGLFVKDNKGLRDALENIGQESGDIVWPLPLADINEKDIEGKFADVVNTHKSSSRWGGASTAAAFLSYFAKPNNFAHIDMAPRMLALTEEEFLLKGSAGFGVRFLKTLAEKWNEVQKILK